jgi:hypothetical protein
MAVNRRPKDKDDKQMDPASQKMKQYVLLGVAVALILFAIFMFTRGGGNSVPAVQPATNARNHPGLMTPGMIGPMPDNVVNTSESKQEQQEVVLAKIDLPEISKNHRDLVAAAQEYLVRYNQSANPQKLAELGRWAYEHGLYVEAINLFSMENHPPRAGSIYNTRFLYLDPEKKTWKLISQVDFEKNLPAQTSSQMGLARKAATRLEQLKSGSGSSNQSELASLLVLVDTPNGRLLYKEAIKDKGFYSLLIRAMKRTFLNNVSSETIWQTSWLRAQPMNLWLIEQMIDLDPSVFTSVDNEEGKKETTNPPGMAGPGMPPVGMMGPGMGPGMGPAPNMKPLPGLAHRLLILQLLARRGGMVSATLIGKLIENDKDSTILNGIIQGQVDVNLLSRFTGIYAEPLVDAFAKSISSFSGQQSDWLAIAKVLADRNNDRAAALVFSSAGSNMILSKELVFSLAAGGNRYAIENLGNFIKTSRIQDIDVNALFQFWTEISPTSGKSLWRMFGQLLPKMSAAGADHTNNEPVGQPIAGPAGMGPGTYPPGMIPPAGGPMPPGGMPPGGMPGMPGPIGMPPGMAQGGTQDVTKTFGWPVERTFVSGINKQAVIDFLKILGDITADASALKNTQNVPPYGPNGPMGFGTTITAIDNAGKARVKRSAMQCLISLNDPSLGDYFRKKIDDAVAGDYARLGLCILHDQESCGDLLTYFWKHPLEINQIPATTQGETVQPVSASAGKIGVPLDSAGLAMCGVSAREALIYFDYRQASEAFMASLGTFLTHKDAYDEPEKVANAACDLIEAIGRWTPPNAASMLADLIESTSDFGLRDANRSESTGSNPMATKVRMNALGVLGVIGDQESMNVILRIATYSRPDELLGVAAKIALAKRGFDEAGGLFLDMLDPAIRSKTENIQSSITDQISRIDPSIKSADDIALLGLSRVKLNDIQVERAMGLIKTLGKPEYAGSGSVPLQQRMFLSLLESGHGTVLMKLAELVGRIPSQKSNQQSDNDPYYWNRQSNSDRDKSFLEMIQALTKHTSFEDEKAVVAFVTSVLRREEAVLVPNRESLEQWDPLQYIVQFDRNSSFNINPGMFMQPGVGGVPGLPGSKQQTDKTNRYQLDIRFRTISEQNSDQTPQKAAIEGMKLVARLKEAATYFAGMRELNYFRYLADFMLWQDGNAEGGEELSKLLAAENQSKLDTYLKFLAIEQLQRSENPELMILFAGVLADSSDLLTRAKVGDAAMYIAIETWRERMLGKSFLLSNPQQTARIADGWAPVMDGKKYDWALANRLIVALAPLQVDVRVLKWMSDLVRNQYSKNEPVAESSLGNAVEMLRLLVPQGNTDLLNFYTTVLSLTYDPNKAEQAAKKTSEAMVATGGKRDMMPGPGMLSPTMNRGQITGSRNKPIPAYTSIGPAIIQAIGAMTIPESQSALVQLARSRQDLLGLIAVNVYPKDEKQGLSLFRQLLNDSGKKTELAEQARMSAAFLLKTSEPAAMDLLFRVLPKTDATTAGDALRMLTEMNNEGKLPTDFDVKQATRSLLQGLTTEIRGRRDMVSVLEQAIKFGESFSDSDIDRVIERARKTLENLNRQPVARPTRRR